MMRWRCSYLALALAASAGAFVAPRAGATRSRLRSSPDVEPEPDVSSFYAALRSRSEELEDASATIRSRWTSGACVSRVAVAAGDWVRRMAYDDGVAAFGTASGGVGARASRAPSRTRRRRCPRTRGPSRPRTCGRSTATTTAAA